MGIKEIMSGVQALSGLQLRIAVCSLIGWNYDEEKIEWTDPETGNKVPTIDLPPYESDLNQAFRLMQTHGLALIPQTIPNEPDGRYLWLCTGLECVTYADQIEIKEREYTAFASMDPCEAICKAFFIYEYMADNSASQPESQDEGDSSNAIQDNL